jgi:hypothetical protein
MLKLKRMKHISGSICKSILPVLILVLSGTVSGQEVSGQEVPGQDTLRTYGPRFGIDLSRFLYLLTDPAQVGAEVSADFEIYKNMYPVVELGYNTVSESKELFDYESRGNYLRAGFDYNILPVKDRSVHHAITVGLRYGISKFTHKSENVFIPNSYWGDYYPETYENSLKAQWLEVAGGMKAEVLPNLFLGWYLRIKLMFKLENDPVMVPEMIPGYGTGGVSRVFGISYSISYKIPLLKK